MQNTQGTVLPRKVVVCVVVAFLVGAVSAIPAFAERPNSGKGEEIRGAVTGILGKTDTLVTNLGKRCDAECQGTEAGKAFGRKISRLKSAQTRARNAHGRMTVRDYDEVNRKGKKQKSVDGCNPEEEVCIDDESAAALSVSTSSQQYDEDRGKDVIEDLTDVVSEIDELNGILAGSAKPVPPPKPELPNAEYFFSESMYPSTPVLLAAFGASQLAEKAALIADHFCDQTVVALGAGGNGSSACAVFTTISEVLKIAYETIGFVDQEKSSAEITGTYQRVGSLSGELQGTREDLNAVKFVVEAMGKKMLELEQNQKFIIQLLQTPPGRRPGFPTTK